MHHSGLKNIPDNTDCNLKKD